MGGTSDPKNPRPDPKKRPRGEDPVQDKLDDAAANLAKAKKRVDRDPAERLKELQMLRSCKGVRIGEGWAVYKIKSTGKYKRFCACECEDARMLFSISDASKVTACPHDCPRATLEVHEFDDTKFETPFDELKNRPPRASAKVVPRPSVTDTVEDELAKRLKPLRNDLDEVQNDLEGMKTGAGEFERGMRDLARAIEVLLPKCPVCAEAMEEASLTCTKCGADVSSVITKIFKELGEEIGPMAEDAARAFVEVRNVIHMVASVMASTLAAIDRPTNANYAENRATIRKMKAAISSFTGASGEEK